MSMKISNDTIGNRTRDFRQVVRSIKFRTLAPVGLNLIMTLRVVVGGTHHGYFFLFGRNNTPPPKVGQSPLIHKVSRSHNDAPRSIGLPWTSDQLVAETSTWQHTTLTTDIHAPSGIRTHNLIRRAAADKHLRPRQVRKRGTIRWNADFSLFSRHLCLHATQIIVQKICIFCICQSSSFYSKR